MVTRQIVVKTAPCRQHAREAAAIQTFAVQLRDAAPYVMNGQFSRQSVAGKFKQRFDVAPVIFGGVRREPALMRQMIDITLQQWLRGSGCGCR